MGKRARRAPKKRAETIVREVGRIVPSDSWFGDLRGLMARLEKPHAQNMSGFMERGVLKMKDDMPAEFAKRGIFPPGPSRYDRSPVHTPMLPCHCWSCRGERMFPFYYRRGAIRLLPRFRVTGVNAEGGQISVDVTAETEPIAREKALRMNTAQLDSEPADVARESHQMVRIFSVRRIKKARRIAASDECRAEIEAERIERRRKDVPAPSMADAVGIQLKVYGVRPHEMKLPTEDEGALRRQIDRYMSGRKTSLMAVSLAG